MRIDKERDIFDDDEENDTYNMHLTGYHRLFHDVDNNNLNSIIYFTSRFLQQIEPNKNFICYSLEDIDSVNGSISYPEKPIKEIKLDDLNYTQKVDYFKGTYYTNTRISFYDTMRYYNDSNELQEFHLEYYVYFYGRRSIIFVEDIYEDKIEELKNILMDMDSCKSNKRIDPKVFPKECEIATDKICKFFYPENISRLRKFGYPNQYGIILVGTPGSGKSVYVNYLFNKIKKNNSDFDIIYYTPSDVMNSVNNGYDIESEGIIVFDDVDSLLKEKKAEANNDSILSWFLTQTDVTMSTGINRLLILVANSLEFVEPAIIRPGRFDSIIRFNEPNEEQIKNMIKFVIQYDTEMTNDEYDYYVELIKNAVKKDKEPISLASIALAGRLFYSNMVDNWEEAFKTATERNFDQNLSSMKKKIIGFGTTIEEPKIFEQEFDKFEKKITRERNKRKKTSSC